METALNSSTALSTHPFVAGMAEEHIQRLSQFAEPVTFEADRYLFRAGETATRFYLVSKGRVAIEIFDASRGPVSVQTVEAPSVVGWSWLVPPYRWCFDARALTPVEAVALDTEKLRAFCHEDHDFGYDFLKRCIVIFAERLYASRFQLLDMLA
ncbi:MAG: cyclic nucleotide-binding domain-containing protein [Candidatus Hydrogenedentes bacterium]|nr:cyclic nucleotide-binding domain-containing protein [Candidatus Hydrogenedentota bacterium]